ncbi:MAG TPA: tetratricopeptide repeat protein [Terriglobales bacterium]|nr:tetratricopeptide repeat protein [Terriglobales bacterium]
MLSVKNLSIVVLLALLPSLSVADLADSKLLAAGRVDDAIASLQHRIGKAPADAESYNLLCRAYFTLGDWDKGIAACEKAVSLQPENSQYHLWLGRVYGEKADHSHFLSAAGLAKRVRSEFETAVRLNPNSAEARTDLAEFYLEAPGIVGGGRDKAEAQAQKLAAIDPVRAGWVKGRLAEKNKDLVSAENAYRGAIEASHGAALAWLNLAFFFRHAGRPDAMEDAIRHASSAPMDQPEVVMESAEMLLRSKRDLPQAIQLLRRYLSSDSAVEAAPAFKAHYLLGTALEQQGDKAAAAQEYRASLSLAKSFALAQTALDRLNGQVADVANR